MNVNAAILMLVRTDVTHYCRTNVSMSAAPIKLAPARERGLQSVTRPTILPTKAAVRADHSKAITPQIRCDRLSSDAPQLHARRCFVLLTARFASVDARSSLPAFCGRESYVAD